LVRLVVTGSAIGAGDVEDTTAYSSKNFWAKILIIDLDKFGSI